MQRFTKVVFVFSLVVGLFYSSLILANSITVTNYSFELPGVGKIKGWNGEGVAGTPAVDIPGWASDTTVADSGVETGYTPTDGIYTAFLMGSDPSVWQVTNHTIGVGEVFTLKVDGRITGGTPTLQIDLYYDNGGSRVSVANTQESLTSGMQEFTLTFTADTVPASIGNPIGIEFNNIQGGGSWLGLDNVRLEVAGSLAGDIDGDGKVNLVDLYNFTLQYLDEPGGNADMIDDDRVDLFDYNILAVNWLKSLTFPSGSLIVTIEPTEAITAGAQWRVDEGDWHDSGYEQEGLMVGQHTVQFSDISGWATPGNQIVTIYEDLPTATNAVYTQQTGSLEISIEPAGARSAGAQWQVDGGDWHDSGYIESGLSIDIHLVEFSDIAGWNTPLDMGVEIFDGVTTQETGTYVEQTGSLQVTIEPEGARTAGAQWRVDDGTWRNSDYTETGLSLGSHTVDYNIITDWDSPPSVIVSISNDITTTTTGTYTQQTGSLQVTIEPQGARDAGAQWQVDGGAWHDSGYTEPGLIVGQHTVNFSTVSSWATPGSQQVQINNGQTTTPTGTYTQQVGSLQVAIEPAGAISAGAQWRVDSGTWRDSGYTESDLGAGSHTVSYSTVSGWNTPSNEVVQINEGSTTYETGTYTEQATDPATVVINEIHYNPDLKKDFVEFIELYNPGVEDVDISNWFFDDGISYEFPPSTILLAGDYIIVAEDVSAVQTKYGVSAGDIYGPFTGGLSNEGENIELCNAAGVEIDQVDYQLGFPWPTIGGAVPDTSPGSGNSIQLMNAEADNDLAGSWRSAYPTPAAHNSSVYASNLPPQIRQVDHSPNSPTSSETVTITAKVTDPDGVSSVTLHYQLVVPGSYIPIRFPNGSDNPDYENPSNWSDLTMYDDGTHGDAFSGDSVYTAEMPGSVQGHRNLIRYRITVEDTAANSLTVPYPDDEQPNFAYFIYNGVPSYTADGVTYSSSDLTSIQVVHVLSRGTDISTCHSGGETDYIYPGTVVYDGEVYDHVFYRIKGAYSYNIEGKKKWKFNFHRGHRLKLRDDYGTRYKEKWDKLNLSTGTCPYWQEYGWDSGVDGMILNEAATFRFFSLAGVPSPNTSFLHVRVIDNASENGTNQYTGDFWGLYIGVEQEDIRFINEHDLPDGNLYKMAGSAYGANQGPTEPDISSKTDVNAFISGYESHPAQSWWESTVNMDNYYRYRTVGVVTNNSDPRPSWNCFYYHNPITDKWYILPWDVDLTYEYATHYSDNEHLKYSIQDHSALNQEYENRARELQDLLFNDEQAEQLLDELAAIVGNPLTTHKFHAANRSRWEYDPYVVSRGRDGLFYRSVYFDNFPEVVSYMKDFISVAGLGSSYGGGKLTADIADSAIPNTPTITYTGMAGYPENKLTFETSAFSDPQGSGTFAAMKWRLGRVDNPSDPDYDLRERHNYEIETKWESAEITDSGDRTITIPATEVEIGGTYRVRCRMKDNTGRWNHWSDPIEFVPAEPYLEPILTDLRLTELMYHPTVSEDYEFIELKNTGGTTLDLSDVYFSDGIDFSFGGFVAGTPLMDTGYDSDSDGFTYADDTFGTSNPAFATGTYESSGGQTGGGLRVYLGQTGVATTSPMSGGWSRDFTLSSSGTVTIDVSYHLIISDNLDSDEYGEAVLTVDGTRYGGDAGTSLIHKAGNGNDTGYHDDYGWLSYQTTIGLNTGTHTITLGAYCNKTSSTNAEWVEVFFDDVTVTPMTSTSYTLGAGEYVLVVKDQTAFESRYGTGMSGKIAGEYDDGGLNNGGETVKLVDAWNGAIFKFTYSDGRGWPVAADGSGHSMVPLDSAIAGEYNGSLEYGGNWRRSSYINGSPGQADPAVPATTVVINEFMAHTNYASPPPESNDWIELYNTSGSTVNLDSDWFLSNNVQDLTKWALPATALTSHNWVSFDEITGFNQGGTGFNLEKEGDYVVLSYLPGTSADRVVDCLKFKGQQDGISLNRYPDGGEYWFPATGSQDSANNAPSNHVVISEVMYNPTEDPDQNEYIEIYNPTGSSVNMWTADGSWAIDGGVNYEFPASTTIGAGQRILIVDFDPWVDTVRLDDFETAYGLGSLTAGVDIFGGWSGDGDNLSNAGERVTLEMPEDTLDPYWIIVDEVIYGDYTPWPTTPDGGGDALERISTAPDDSGNDPTNWQADTPSPGS